LKKSSETEFEKLEQIKREKRQPYLVHRSDIRAERVVDMEGRESENHAGNERGGFVLGEIVRQQIRPETGENERKKKQNIVPRDPPEHQKKERI